MANMSTRVALVFGTEWLEVEAPLAERRGGLRALICEATAKWALKPNTFSLMGISGRVDSLSALQREMRAASSGVCKLEVQENSEAKIMRQVHAAVKASEDRILARLEASIGILREDLGKTNKQVSGVLAPMVQCMSLEHMELHKKVSGVLAPMVQCLALQQMDLHSQVGQVAAEACSNQLDNMKHDINQLASLAAPVGFDVPTWTQAGKADSALDHSDANTSEAFEQQLESDCALQAAQDLHNSAQDDLVLLRMEVCSLDQSNLSPSQPAAAQASSEPPVEKCEDMAQQKAAHDSTEKSEPMQRVDNLWREVDAWLPLPPPLAGFTYSSKSIAPGPSLPLHSKWSQREMWVAARSGNDDVAVFPRHRSHPRLCSTGWSWGSRSMPTLPPL